MGGSMWSGPPFFWERTPLFSSAVPSGSRAFQMPTCPASSASTLGGGSGNLGNASVTFSLFSSASRMAAELFK